MGELEYDVNRIAANMADALAVMHRRVRIDADDVEFVLDSAPTRTTFALVVQPLTATDINSMPKNTSTWTSSFENFKRRTVRIWILDFDPCKDIPLEKKVVEQVPSRGRFFQKRPILSASAWAKFTRSESLDCF
jgi:hypothetical protein